ncbi:MAG: LLM class flavin-dependent oxidoreductase [Acidimicrobiia bacterium]
MHTVSVPFPGYRQVPPQAAGQFAQALESSGVVDQFQAWDQLTSWYPQGLWTPANAPAAAAFPDCDSFQDAFVSAAFAAAMTGDLGVTVSTDATRRGPAELLQTMLTLSDGIGRPAVLQLGAAELKQTKPFGYKRSQGLGRLEESLQIMGRLLDSDGLISFEGQYHAYQDAWIGGAKPHRPRFYALGGGPRLFDIAARYADGIVTIAPFAYPTPEEFAGFVAAMKERVESHGRDPDDFTVGLWYAALLDDGSGDLDALCDNELMRFFAAMSGRLEQSRWRAEGLEPVWPDDWHYALRLLPASVSPQEARDVAARTPREMVRKSFFMGSPAEVAETMRDYAEAGATYHSLCDMAPVARGLDRLQAAMAAELETCAAFKVKCGVAAG